MTFRKWPKTNARTLINFNNLIDQLETAGDVLVCVPVALVDIIRKLLRDRGLWRTTYVISQDDIGYTIPTQEEFKPIEDMISQFLWETNEMKCDDLITALNGIASAVTASSCCTGLGPGYLDDGAGGVWYGTQSPLERPTTFGEGQEFETEGEFSAHLCQAANNIVSGLIMSLNNWSIATLASLIAGGLLVAFIVATPPVALFLALAALGFAFGTFHTMANHIDTERESWVCAIYSAESYSDMLVNIDALIEDMSITLDIGAFEVVVTDIIHAMLSTDVFNQAYQAIGLPPVTGTEIDCSVCVDSCEDEIDVMVEEIEGDYGTITNIDIVSPGVADIYITSEYRAAEDHELAGWKLKQAYIDAGCCLWTNGFTLVTGPAGTRAMNYTRCDNDQGVSGAALNVVASTYQAWVGASTTISPGTYTCILRVQKEQPA